VYGNPKRAFINCDCDAKSMKRLSGKHDANGSEQKATLSVIANKSTLR